MVSLNKAGDKTLISGRLVFPSHPGGGGKLSQPSRYMVTWRLPSPKRQVFYTGLKNKPIHGLHGNCAFDKLSPKEVPISEAQEVMSRDRVPPNTEVQQLEVSIRAGEEWM